MRTPRPDRPLLARARRGLASLGYACLTASLFVGAYCLHARRGPGDFVADAEAAHRRTVGAEVLEERCSAGFPEIADLIAEAPEVPGWAPFRLVLEERGEVDAWYSLRVGWRLEDGGREEVTYVLQPYHDRDQFLQVVQLAREGRLQPSAGRDAGFDPGRDGSRSGAAPLAADLAARAARRKAREASKRGPSATTPTP
jgi:hypothetical protein